MGNKNSSEDKTNSGSNQQKQEDNLSALDEHPVTGSNKQEQEQNMPVLEKLHVAFNSHYDAVERFSEFTTTQQKTADEMMNLKFSEDEAAKNNREDLFMKCSSHLQKEQEISESLKASLFKLFDSINENLKENGYSVLCTSALVGANEHPEKPAQENINRDANITVLEKNPKRITSKKKEIEEEDIEKQKKHQPKNKYTETILLQAKGYVEQLEEKITNLDAYISAEKKELEEKYKNHTETILIQAKRYVEQLEEEITNLNANITAEKKGLEEKCKKSAEYADHLWQQLNKNIQRKNETTEHKDKKRRGEIEKQEKQEIKNKYTDSLCYEIETKDAYEDFYKDKNLFDNSDYSSDSQFYFDNNKKVIGKFKDEAAGIPIIEFVGLRSKMYSY